MIKKGEKKMRRARKKQKNGNPIKNEIISIMIISIGIFILISLQTQSAGQIGKFVRQLLRGLFSLRHPFCLILLFCLESYPSLERLILLIKNLKSL